MKRLWRWLTYKRVLIVFDGNRSSMLSMTSLRNALEQRHVWAVFVRIDNYETPFAVFALDDLKPTQFGWLKAELDKYAQPPVMAESTDEQVEKFADMRPGQFIRVESEGRGEYLTPDLPEDLTPRPTVVDPKELL